MNGQRTRTIARGQKIGHLLVERAEQRGLRALHRRLEEQHQERRHQDLRRHARTVADSGEKRTSGRHESPGGRTRRISGVWRLSSVRTAPVARRPAKKDTQLALAGTGRCGHQEARCGTQTHDRSQSGQGSAPLTRVQDVGRGARALQPPLQLHRVHHVGQLRVAVRGLQSAGTGTEVSAL